MKVGERWSHVGRGAFLDYSHIAIVRWSQDAQLPT